MIFIWVRWGIISHARVLMQRIVSEAETTLRNGKSVGLRLTYNLGNGVINDCHLMINELTGHYVITNPEDSHMQ